MPDHIIYYNTYKSRFNSKERPIVSGGKIQMKIHTLFNHFSPISVTRVLDKLKNSISRAIPSSKSSCAESAEPQILTHPRLSRYYNNILTHLPKSRKTLGNGHFLSEFCISSARVLLLLSLSQIVNFICDN